MMELARVVGTLWATQQDPTFRGGRLMVLQPIDEARRPSGQSLVAMDTVGAGVGEVVFYTTFYEATIPWRRRHPGAELTPVGASIVGIVDRIDVAPRPRKDGPDA
jgi:ethanolamine utilization protein EutN